MKEEILAAEIYLHPVDTKAATADIDAALGKIESSLKAYDCTLSLFDCSAAVISGLLAGAADAFLFQGNPSSPPTRVPLSDFLKGSIARIVGGSPALGMADKQTWKKAADIGLPMLIQLLEKNADQPNALGLLAAVIVQIRRGGLLQEDDKKLIILPEGISKGKGMFVAAVSAVVGILKWLSSISAKNPDQIPYKNLKKLCELIRSSPVFAKLVTEIEKWQRRLMNEIKTANSDDFSRIGIQSLFHTVFSMLGSSAALNNAALQKAVLSVEPLRNARMEEIPVFDSLRRQAIPVLINEIIVRSVFFATRLARELNGKSSADDIIWENVLPFGNRNIDRMLTISTITLSVADTADAAIHAAIDSCGSFLCFSNAFVPRFNYIAAGRAAGAIVKEVSYERQQAELIHTKRLLEEAKTVKALDILRDYQQKLEKRVEEYLTENITAFLEGIECMDRGLAINDSNLVIGGNIVIQRALGRESPFTNQREFDDLMDSDTPIQL